VRYPEDGGQALSTEDAEKLLSGERKRPADQGEVSFLILAHVGSHLRQVESALAARRFLFVPRGEALHDPHSATGVRSDLAR